MKKISIALFFFFFAAYLLTASGKFYRRDAMEIGLTTSSLAHGKIDITGKPGFGIQYGARGRNGKYYSFFEIGTAFVNIPFYAIGKLVSRIAGIEPLKFIIYNFSNCFFASLLCVLFFNFCDELNFKKNISAALTFVLGFGTYIWTYSKIQGYDIIYTLIFMLILYLLLKHKKYKEKEHFFAAALLYGFSIFFRITFLVLFPLFLLFLFIPFEKQAVKENLKKAVFFVFPALFAVIALLIFNYYRFGSILLDPRSFALNTDGFFEHKFYLACFSMVFSPGKSIFLYNPALLIIFLEYKTVVKYKIGMFLVFVLFYLTAVHSFFFGWSGDWGWGLRYLMPGVVCWLAASGFIYEKITKKYKFLFAALLVISVFINVASVTLNPFAYFMYADSPVKTHKFLKKKYLTFDNHLTYQITEFCKGVSEGISRKEEIDTDANWYYTINADEYKFFDFWLYYLFLFESKIYAIVILIIILAAQIFSLRWGWFLIEKD